MAYLSLARKYRPASFEELKGQESTMLALMNSIKMQREPHAVVFSGIRGVGKTTLARIYAKALNCESGPTPNPCGTCESCIAISKGYHEDVLEIDGASNTGVDDVRSLKDQVSYAAQRSSFKVFIIDEVHMLSQNAFNALLKTLEEPPKHVVFIFATTEFQKIPQTILSRCQVFHLNKLSLETITNRIQEILKLELIPFEEEACRVIAKEGRGSLRDALTLLDQAVAFSDGGVTKDSLGKFLNFISTEKLISILEAILNKQSSTIIHQISEMDQSGIIFSDLLENLILHLRNLSIIKAIGNKASELQKLSLAPSEIESLFALSEKFPISDFQRLFRCLIPLVRLMDGSHLDRFILENTLLEWCFDEGIPTLEELKSEIQSGSSITKTQSQASVTPSPNLKNFSNPPVQMSKNNPTDNHSNVSNEVRAGATSEKLSFPLKWKDLIDHLRKLKPLLARLLEEATIDLYSRDRIEISLAENGLAASKLNSKENQEKLKETLRQIFNFNGEFTVKLIQNIMPTISNKVDTHTTASNTVLPGSLLETRKEISEQKNQSALAELKNSAITVEALSLFDGTIEKEVLKT